MEHVDELVTVQLPQDLVEVVDFLQEYHVDGFSSRVEVFEAAVYGWFRTALEGELHPHA